MSSARRAVLRRREVLCAIAASTIACHHPRSPESYGNADPVPGPCVIARETTVTVQRNGDRIVLRASDGAAFETNSAMEVHAPNEVVVSTPTLPGHSILMVRLRNNHEGGGCSPVELEVPLDLADQESRTVRAR